MYSVNLEDWIPYKLVNQDDKLQCRWLNTGNHCFTDPFFEETILKCRTSDVCYTKFPSVSSIDAMNEWADGLNEVWPDAFIFHISRCGSTLASQLLATSEKNVVLSEVPFFDDILRLPFKMPAISGIEIDRSFLSAIKYYGQKCDEDQGRKRRLFIKTDSWHLFFYKQFRRLFPSVPFIFLYRRPDEVFASHRKKVGMQAVQGLIEPQVFGFNPDDINLLSPEAYLERVLESYFTQCLEIMETDERALFLNYNEGAMPIIKKIAAFTNMSLNDDELKNMEQRSAYRSKEPNERFYEEPLNAIPPGLHRAMDLYHKLEKQKSVMQH